MLSWQYEQMQNQTCWLLVKSLTLRGGDLTFAYLVAREKGLSVWHNTSGTDNKITAICLPISKLDIKWPWSSWVLEIQKCWGFKKGSNKRIVSNTKSTPHPSQEWLFAVGNWAAPQRWGSFPPHTGIPIKHCGTPEVMSKQKKILRKPIKERQMHKVICFQEEMN